MINQPTTRTFMRRPYILCSISILPIIVFGVLLVARNKQTSSTLMIADFNPEGVCAALTPSCGYCPGTEANGNCYATQLEFDEYKKHYPALKAR